MTFVSKYVCLHYSCVISCHRMLIVSRLQWQSSGTPGKAQRGSGVSRTLFFPPCIHPFYLPACLHACSVTSVFVTPRAVACQAPLSMEFPRQEYWSGLPFPPPGGLPDPGTKPVSPALAGGISTTGSPGKPSYALLIPSAK